MKYEPKQYSRWWWGVLDTDTNLYVRKEDGKLLLFKTKSETEIWIQNTTERKT